MLYLYRCTRINKGENDSLEKSICYGGYMKTTKQSYRQGQVIRYWHPVKGGWYTATIIKYGRKYATLRSLTPNIVVSNGKRELRYRKSRVPVDSVRPATIGDLL